MGYPFASIFSIKSSLLRVQQATRGNEFNDCHLLSHVREINGLDLPHVGSAGELVEIVPDAAKFVRDAVGSLNDHDFLPENTVAEIVAQLVVSPRFAFQPRFFFRRDPERNDDIFCLHFVQIVDFLSDLF